MAWYDVDYSCGHSDRIQCYGPTRGRQAQADEGRKLCPECYREQRDKRNAEQSAKDADAAKVAQLPTLSGSDKQVAWAETIRARMLNDLAPYAAKAAVYRSQLPAVAEQIGASATDKRLDDVAAWLTGRIAHVRSQASAKWWIDHRYDDLTQDIHAGLMTQVKTLFAVEIETAKARKAEAEARKAQAENDAHAAARAEQQSDNDRSESAAFHFRPLRVDRDGENLTIYGDGNHLAKGYCADGDWVIYEIDDLTVNSLLPNATALAARVRKLCVGHALAS